MHDVQFRSRALALVATLAWTGVLLQLVLSIRLGVANGVGVVSGIVAYLGYFTVLTNLLVAFVASRGARRRRMPTARDAMWLGCATASITMVGLVYHVLLREVWDPQGWQWVADMLLHYATPTAMLGYWLFAGPGRRLPAWAPLAWCVYIGGYLAYALLRGAWLGSYPYYFIDVGQLGASRVAANAAGMFVLFVLVGYAVLAASRMRASAQATN